MPKHLNHKSMSLHEMEKNICSSIPQEHMTTETLVCQTRKFSTNYRRKSACNPGMQESFSFSCRHSASKDSTWQWKHKNTWMYLAPHSWKARSFLEPTLIDWMVMILKRLNNFLKITCQISLVWPSLCKSSVTSHRKRIKWSEILYSS